MVKLYHLAMTHDNEETERLIAVKDEHKDWKCWGFWCQLLLSLLGIIFLCSGIIMTDLWPQIFDSIMKNELKLINNTQTYRLWQQIPAPLYMEVYLFNWTNVEESLQRGDKPILQQLGPYVFKENHTKVYPTFNKNGTITYKQLKSWQYDSHLSNGSLSDNITTTNIVLNVLGDLLQAHNKHWVNVLVNWFFKLSKLEQPYVTKTAGEFLFDGYHDPLLDIIVKIKQFISIDIPIEKLGWFSGLNMSTKSDGIINMFTGENDVESIGLLHSVNYNTKLNVFNKDCNFINASAGDLWPISTTIHPNASIFVPNICSAITMTNQNEVYINDIKGVEFVGSSDVFSNTCYCPSSGCLLPGVRSLALCGNSALHPLFISFPHFYLADESYRKSVIGMKPNRTLHEFKIILEKKYSIPLHIAARLQFNVKIHPIKDIKIMKNLPDVILPVFWFSESFEITSDLSSKLYLTTNLLPTGMPYLWLTMALIGSLMLVISTYIWVKRKNESSTILDPVQ